jgi:hypothetical protein
MVNLPNVSSRYGAPMGRASLIPSKEVAETMRVSLRRVRINGGGYDDGGAYWGHGQPLYWAGDDDGIIDIWFRARDRDDAKAQVRARCPNAMFYR